MKTLTQSFRWYGPNDPVTLQDIRQCGATDIVTALHHVPNGAVWTQEEILKRQQEVSQAGLTWSVVESLPVTEDIKTQSGDWKQHLENYKVSLQHLAEAGITIVTYNFMPILDWTRTDLLYQLPEGYYTVAYNHLEVIAFDLFILKREGAEKDYTDQQIELAKKVYDQLDHNEENRLLQNILKGLPGSEIGYSIEEFREKLATYDDIDHAKLKAHQYHFLREICPLTEELGVKMVVHPDDPPYDIFGLPRIVSNAQDLDDLFDAVPSSSNGLCFCTGSLGVSPNNDLVTMAKKNASRVHFLHFRSTRRDEFGNFFEDNHLDGDANIPEVIKVFIAENQKREKAIPFRPDHGYTMLDDIGKKTNPGYACIGRMKGLAEIRGLERGILVMQN